jgi:hypothetical protein
MQQSTHPIMPTAAGMSIAPSLGTNWGRHLPGVLQNTCPAGSAWQHVSSDIEAGMQVRSGRPGSPGYRGHHRVNINIGILSIDASTPKSKKDFATSQDLTSGICGAGCWQTLGEVICSTSCPGAASGVCHIQMGPHPKMQAPQRLLR